MSERKGREKAERESEKDCFNGFRISERGLITMGERERERGREDVLLRLRKASLK
jgi:hypothetical protein